MLGVCRPDGSVTHYRGVIRAVTDGTTNRTVNLLPIELYLRGVLSREVSTSWGDAANGAGMNSLWAMAVAARSFAHSQGRYSLRPDVRHRDVPGLRRRGVPAQPRRADVVPDGDAGVRDRQQHVRVHQHQPRRSRDRHRRVRIRSDGQIISGEYSATHGPYSSGVNFPVVDDSVSRVPGNPLYTWTRTVSAADIVATYPEIGTFTGAYSERDPASTANGVWGNRIVLEGTAGAVVVGNLAFRTTFRFPSHGFSVAAST